MTPRASVKTTLAMRRAFRGPRSQAGALDFSLLLPLKKTSGSGWFPNSAIGLEPLPKLRPSLMKISAHINLRVPIDALVLEDQAVREISRQHA